MVDGYAINNEPILLCYARRASLLVFLVTNALIKFDCQLGFVPQLSDARVGGGQEATHPFARLPAVGVPKVCYRSHGPA